MRKDKETKKITLLTASPCPCGSGKAIVDCHLDPEDGRFRRPVPLLQPPGDPTGYAHPKCYLRGTRNCSDKISREHYVSKSILERIGNILKIEGSYWLDEGKYFEASIGNLTAKILCERHNNSLSPLDSEANIFFGSLQDALEDLKRRTLSRKPIFHLASGEALELWFLKVACGHYFGIASYEDGRLQDAFQLDMDRIERALYERKWDARCGLYFKYPEDRRMNVASGISVNALLDEPRKQMVGVTIDLLGVTMDLLFDSADTNPGAWEGLVRHPTELVWRRRQRRHSIILTWPPGTPENSITMIDKSPPGLAHTPLPVSVP